MIRKAKKKFFSNLNTCDVTDNKTFWKTVKPFLTEKGVNFGKITLVDENEGVISDDCKISNTFSEYFENAAKKSDLSNSYSLNDIEPTSIGPLENALNKFNGHPSVLKIQGSIVCNIGFSFFEINESEVLEEIEKLDKKKNGTYENISVKAIKEASEICNSSITN